MCIDIFKKIALNVVPSFERELNETEIGTPNEKKPVCSSYQKNYVQRLKFIQNIEDSFDLDQQLTNMLD